MLQSMRKQAKGFLAFLLFGLLILSFAVWGIGDIFTARSDLTEPVIEVGDQTVTGQEVLRAVDQRMRDMQLSDPGNPELTQTRRLLIAQRTIGEMTADALLGLGADDLGIAVSDATVQRAIIEEPGFQGVTGQFDTQRYRQVLASIGFTPGMYEAEIRNEVARQQLVGALTANRQVPDNVVSKVYQHRRERRVAELLFIPNSAMTDIPEPSDDDLAKFHEDNADAFMASEYRKITAVIIDPESLAKDIEVTDSRLSEVYENQRSDFTVEEKRSLEHILFSDEAAANAAYDRIQGGADFDTVAEETTGAKPIPLGSVTRDELGLPALTDAAFELSEPAVAAPIQSSLGWHIVRVSEIEPGFVRPLEDVGDELRWDIQRDLAIEIAIDLANDLDAAVGSGATLEEAASRLNVPLVEIEAVDEFGLDRNGEAISAIPPESNFLREAFQLGEGEVGFLEETSDGGAFILRVDSITPAALRPLDEVRGEVTAMWKSGRRAEAGAELSAELEERVAGGATLNELANDLPEAVLRSTDPFLRGGNEGGDHMSRALVEALFGATPGEAVSAPVPEGHSVAVLREIKDASAAAESDARKSIESSLSDGIANDILAAYGEALRNRHTVSIDQAAITRILSQ